MPELPEVETVCRLIRPRLVGRRIDAARVHWRPTVGGRTPAAFARAVRAARVCAVRRRGKFIVCELERAGRPDGALVVHLRMTGRLHVCAKDQRQSHERVSCDLDDGQRLAFVDVRKFGRFLYEKEPQRLLRGLGPEPLGEEFTPAWLVAALRRRKRLLKPLLLDQTFLAGLGNIYVDESLHRAGLHPLIRSDLARSSKVERLHAAIRATLRDAIEREGSSFDAFYRTPEGRPGSYQHQFQVYGRDGEPCRTCGRRIRKLVVGQRGTHVCPSCQRRPRSKA